MTNLTHKSLRPGHGHVHPAMKPAGCPMDGGVINYEMCIMFRFAELIKPGKTVFRANEKYDII